MSAANVYRQPPSTTRADGQVRRIGIELEFSGVSLDTAARCVQSALGGECRRQSAATRVIDTDAGQFSVTVDWEYLIRRAAEQGPANDGAEWLDDLTAAAALLVPIEVVCPPIPLTQVAQLDALVQALREAGATGTRESVLAAYGLHINVEPPALDASTLEGYLQAFGLLQWWLVAAHGVDTTRRLSQYISLYPERYVTQLATGATASIASLMGNYLKHNASRNRALDMLPMFAGFDAERVRNRVDDSLIQARPTFHYRLPNCDIDRPGWSVSNEWNVWCVIEELASRPEERRQLAAAFQAQLRPVIGLNQQSWKDYTDAWIQDREWV